MKKLLLGLITLSAFQFSYGQYSQSYIQEQKERQREFIRNHPYSNNHYTKEELKAIPKADRPDLANQLNHLQTMDPATGLVPEKGLIQAHKQTDKIRMQKMGQKTAIAGISWTERGPDNVGGRSRAIMWDPNDGTGKAVFAGSVSGGLWKNTDITNSSSTWTAVNNFWDNLAVTSLAADPSTPQTMYAGTGEGFFNVDAVLGGGIWKSTNGGTSWSHLSATGTSTFRYIQKVVVHPTTGDIYVATRDGGVQRSQNGGTSFTKVLGSGAQGSTNRAADVEIAADGTVYASLGMFNTDGVYSSPNGNAGTWTKLNTGGNGFPTSGIRRIELACAPSDANTVYAIAQNGGNALDDIYKTTNAGTSWSTCAKPNDADLGIPANDFTRGQCWYDLSIAVDPNNANTLIVGGIDLFKSTNGGTSWTQISKWSNNANLNSLSVSFVHADQHAAVYKPGSSTEIVFGHDGGVSYSSNANVATPTINDRNNGYNVTQYYAGAINPGSGSNNMIAGAQDNGTQKYTTAGVNSTSEVTGGDGAFCHIDQTSGNNQISQYVYNVIYRTTNNWSGANIISNDQGTGLFINPSDLDDDENILYSSRSSSTLLRISDVFGAASTSTLNITGMTNDASHISVSPHSVPGVSNIFVGTQGGQILKVSNAHSTPTVVDITGTGMPASNVSCIAVGATDNQLLVTFSSYNVTSVWETTNGGTSWTNKEGNLPNMPVRWAVYNPNDYNQAMLATEVGVWSTDDLSAGSVDWDPTNSGLANVRTDMLQVRTSDNTVMASTHGRGVFTAVFPSTGAAPIAAFTQSTTSTCEGGSIAFTDQTANSPTQWNWSFPGGTPATSTAQNPSILYSTAGTYDVTLIATNASGTDTLTQVNHITVLAGPTTTSSSTNESCTGNDGTATTSGGVSYLWDDPLTQTTPTAVGLTAGSYNCTVTNAAGCSTIVNIVVGQDAGCLDSTMLKPQSCGISTADMSTHIWAYKVSGATSYDFEFTPIPSGTPIVVNKNIDHTVLAAVPGLQLGTSYNVRVRANSGPVNGPYGIACTLNLLSVPSPQLDAQYCGQTYPTLYSKVRSTFVSGADRYQYQFVPQGPGPTVVRTAVNWAFVNLAKLQYGTTYTVNVRARVNGVYGAYGPTCNITTAAAPTTQLNTSSCNQTFSLLTDFVKANHVLNADRYRYQFTPQPSGTPITKTISGFGNCSLGGLSYSTTYDCQVSVRTDGVYGPYGPVCTVTLGAAPPVQGPPNLSRLGTGQEDDPYMTWGHLESNLYPNPNDGYEVTIDIRGLSNLDAIVGVYDLSGRQIVTQRLSHTDGHAVQTFRFNEVLSSGVYLVRIDNGTRSQTKKLVIR